MNVQVMNPNTGELQQLVWDVSTGQEFTMIWRHMFATQSFPPLDQVRLARMSH